MDSLHKHDRITIENKVPAEGISCRGTVAVGNGEQNMKRRRGFPLSVGLNSHSASGQDNKSCPDVVDCYEPWASGREKLLPVPALTYTLTTSTCWITRWPSPISRGACSGAGPARSGCRRRTAISCTM